ncbi:MAG: hypothetical protein IPP77_00080 [Bacteroidetes bacterium]|nr:hypothetical protein [Bacteroidota bacterium]
MNLALSPFHSGSWPLRKSSLFFLLLLWGFLLRAQSATDSTVTGPFQQALMNQPANDSLMKDSTIIISLSDTGKQTSSSPTTFHVDSIHRDSIRIEANKKRHSPLKAALFSLAVPGLGQAYNKKYWKIPIVYAGLGGLSFAVYHTVTNFHGYRRAYRAQVADVPDLTASYKGVNDRNTLKSYRDYYKRYVDISAICLGVWHLLSVIDATVDAHLFGWNMRDDLSVSWQPALIAPPTNVSSAATGVRVQLRF